MKEFWKDYCTCLKMLFKSLKEIAPAMFLLALTGAFIFGAFYFIMEADMIFAGVICGVLSFFSAVGILVEYTRMD